MGPESLDRAGRREIIYSKRAILSLLYVPPAFVGGGGGDTLARRRGGWGVNILEDKRDRIALLQ
jgi:hypothetical protein